MNEIQPYQYFHLLLQLDNNKGLTIVRRPAGCRPQFVADENANENDDEENDTDGDGQRVLLEGKVNFLVHEVLVCRRVLVASKFDLSRLHNFN